MVVDVENVRSPGPQRAGQPHPVPRQRREGGGGGPPREDRLPVTTPPGGGTDDLDLEPALAEAVREGSLVDGVEPRRGAVGRERAHDGVGDPLRAHVLVP